MLSPALHRELEKYGLKVIPRRKAVQLLDHIYEETHPVTEEPTFLEEENAEEAVSSQGESMSQGTEADSESSSSSDEDDVPEESLLEVNDDDRDVQPAPVVVTDSLTLSDALKEYIRRDNALYTQVWSRSIP